MWLTRWVTKWSERELMKLRFNLEEIKLEPRYWEKTQEIRNMVFPQEVRETGKSIEKVKQDWEQKYATGFSANHSRTSYSTIN